MPAAAPCPVTAEVLAAEARQRFEQVLQFCLRREYPFAQFEKCLFALLAVLGRLLVRLYLTARHERLDLEPYLRDGQYRRGADSAGRTLKTAWGTVKYGRAQLIRRRGGAGFYPLDAVLAEAEAAGAVIGRLGAATFWGGYSGVFVDPEGHPWEVAHNPGWTLDADGSVRLA